ncbi:Dimer-Tnp-hAT domain containing protein [Pyrenophora tritici-repentis]|nr:Dimer-Tnp-hAT domain containing protein [Pyrenophora tritici-repentis]
MYRLDPTSAQLGPNVMYTFVAPTFVESSYTRIPIHKITLATVIHHLPIDLPQLQGFHSGERIAEVIQRTLTTYAITPQKLGYFVLDNAASNDTAVAALGRLNGFEATYRYLRCGPHTLNLVGQAIIFGKDKDAYDNAADELGDEEAFMEDWRKHGPLGVLMDIINYIKTPQQYELFANFQRLANRDLPTHKQLKILQPVKPVVTWWNSFYGAFERAAHLHSAYNSYAGYRINRVALDDAHAIAHNNKLPEAPDLMRLSRRAPIQQVRTRFLHLHQRSTGLSAADWGVITEYMECLKPLKNATSRLEGRGKGGNFGAIYETIPVFEYLLSSLEALTLPYAHVNFNAHPEAPEDHLAINLKAAWRKANDYYDKLDRSPAYYAAVCLHLYYKFYCDNSWRDKVGWLDTANARFQQLWAEYKPVLPLILRPRAPQASSINKVIGAFVNAGNDNEGVSLDEFERWKKHEPKWTAEQYIEEGNPVQYWMKLRPKYPNLARLALDVMTIPASSSDCERMFSELGDLLEPKRRAIGSQLLAAIQLVRGWVGAGFELPTGETPEAAVTDDDIAREYGICD